MPLFVWFAGLFVAPLLLAVWSFRSPLRRSPWPAILAVLVFGRGYVTVVLANIRAPREWDFRCFWLYGQIAAAKQNVYDPSVFANFKLPFVPSPEFVQAVIKVGFPYPPPTIALFLPLGHIASASAGLAAWYAFQFAALAAAAWVLARTFMPNDGWRGAILIFSLVLALPATQANIQDAQTNFLLLLFIALAVQMTPASGVWQMLAVWTKPFTGALFIFDLVRGHWRTLVVAAATALVSLLGTALLLSPHTMLTYIESSPASREPASTFFEDVNQSLLSMILRAQRTPPAHVSVAHEPVFIVLAALLLIATGVLCARAPRRSELAFALALLVGMLVYPATLTSYGVILIVPLLIFWRQREILPGKTGTAIALVALVTIAQGALQLGFVANLLLWVCAAYLLATRGKNNRALIPSALVPEFPLSQTASSRVPGNV